MNFQALNPEAHRFQYWQKPLNCAHAASDLITPISFAELHRVVLTMPTAFVHRDNAFQMVALLGLREGENLYLNPDKKWLGDYVPAWYRAHPFRLFKNDAGKHVVCIDDAAITTNPESGTLPLYDASGELGAEVREIIKFLTAIAQSSDQTTAICHEIAENDLFIPWQLEVNSGAESVTSVQGLYRINEELLHTLAPEKYTGLIEIGAFKLIYAHLLSLQHVQTLGKLFDANTDKAGHNNEALLDDLFASNEGLNFDNL